MEWYNISSRKREGNRTFERFRRALPTSQGLFQKINIRQWRIRYSGDHIVILFSRPPQIVPYCLLRDINIAFLSFLIKLQVKRTKQ